MDYGKLNKVAGFDAYSMPRIEELIYTVGPAKVISTLDLAKYYWQIPMDEGSKDKTAFITLFGLYKFQVMPFGLHSAPATFQTMYCEIVGALPGYTSMTLWCSVVPRWSNSSTT